MGLFLFPKGSTKMIDSGEKCKCQLAFELQSLSVFEKCSNWVLSLKEVNLGLEVKYIKVL